MNVLDENIPKQQRQLLEHWRIRVRQIGVHLGRRGMQDPEIIPLLLRLRRPTFFTRDGGFFDQTLCHPNYSLVHLAVEKHEVALFIRRLLRRSDFNTHAKRMGTAIRVSRVGLTVWERHATRAMRRGWN